MAPESSQPAKKRRTYRCRRCGFPKKGHVCVAAAAAGGVLPLLPLPEEEEKIDGISALPDDVLHTIISLLPTIGGAKTQLAEGLFVPDIHNGLVDDAAAIECLDLHLKEIVVRNYRGQKSHAAFAKFFILNASVLKATSLEGKASPNARFEFSRDDYFMDYYYNHSQRSHQLSVGDPIDD
ncbi:Os07g0286400 [Oryza sativa Japonica Group]|uniref:Os07g0286400 protein n=1 Tax=Oryza sativa subsp. japonica TaxID=39947 RepID=A0A0P0X4M0_ORYSJ|nr:Os07g0286400 [Oryza sativa Japonica Group]